MALTKVTGQVIKNTTDVTVGVLTVTITLAVGGTVSIGGTLTYEDVTNVDAVGIITARSNILVGSGITLSPDGNIFATGITTLGNSSSSKVIIGNPVNLPTLAASTGLVVADMAGNSYYVDMTILGGRTGRSMVKFGDQDSKDVGSCSNNTNCVYVCYGFIS